MSILEFWSCLCSKCEYTNSLSAPSPPSVTSVAHQTSKASNETFMRYCGTSKMISTRYFTSCNKEKRYMEDTDISDLPIPLPPVTHKCLCLDSHLALRLCWLLLSHALFQSFFSLLIGIAPFSCLWTGRESYPAYVRYCQSLRTCRNAITVIYYIESLSTSTSRISKLAHPTYWLSSWFPLPDFFPYILYQ